MISDNTQIEYLDLKSIIHNDLRMRNLPEFDIKFLATQYPSKKGKNIMIPGLITDLRNAK